MIVCHPIVREITDYNDFTGRTEAVKTVDIRARVSGYLEKVLFKEGMEVKEGDTLFVIDPRTYQADYDRALANVALAKAHLERVHSGLPAGRKSCCRERRSASRTSTWPRAIEMKARRTVMVAKAALKSAKLNLDWTDVAAPISGRISRQMIDPGNMVKADDTVLTTVVSQDPDLRLLRR